MIHTRAPGQHRRQYGMIMKSEGGGLLANYHGLGLLCLAVSLTDGTAQLANNLGLGLCASRRVQ